MKLTSTKHRNYIHDTLNSFFMVNIPMKGFCATIFGIIIYLTGAEPKVLEAIGILLMADLFMGIFAAIRNKTLSSDYLVTVMYKATMYFLLLMGVNWFVTMCPYCSLAKDIMQFLIASAELISILENADLLGFKYAKKIIGLINSFVENKLNKI